MYPLNRLQATVLLVSPFSPFYSSISFLLPLIDVLVTIGLKGVIRREPTLILITHPNCTTTYPAQWTITRAYYTNNNYTTIISILPPTCRHTSITHDSLQCSYSTIFTNTSPAHTSRSRQSSLYLPTRRRSITVQRPPQPLALGRKIRRRKPKR